MIFSKDMTLVEFLKTNYHVKIWIRVVLILGLFLGLMYAWSDLTSGDWIRVALYMIVTPIILYAFHIIFYLIFWVPWFLLIWAKTDIRFGDLNN